MPDPATTTTDTTTPSSSAATGASSSQAAATGDWRSGLGELGEEPFVKQSPDLQTFVKSAVETKRMVGDSIRLPKDDAPQEEWDKFNARFRPETADKYDLPRPEMPEGVEWNLELENEFRGVAHQEGISNRQAKAVVGMFQGRMLKELEAANAEVVAERQKAEGELKKEWGTKFESNLQLAQENAKKVFGDDGFKLLVEHGILGNSVAILRGLANIGSRLGAVRGEPTVVTGDRAESTANQAASEYAEISGNINSPHNPRNPKLGPREIEAAIEYMNQLMQKQIAARA